MRKEALDFIDRFWAKDKDRNPIIEMPAERLSRISTWLNQELDLPEFLFKVVDNHIELFFVPVKDLGLCVIKIKRIGPDKWTVSKLARQNHNFYLFNYEQVGLFLSHYTESKLPKIIVKALKDKDLQVTISSLFANRLNKATNNVV